MSKCDAIVKICANSSLDEIHLRVTNGAKVATACKEIAEEFNTANPGATTTFKALRQAYYRAQKCDNVTVSKKTEKNSEPKCDNVTVSNTPKVQLQVDKLRKTCKRLRVEADEYTTTVDEANLVIDLHLAAGKQWIDEKADLLNMMVNREEELLIQISVLKKVVPEIEGDANEFTSWKEERDYIHKKAVKEKTELMEKLQKQLTK